jgi:hypothetical protein
VNHLLTTVIQKWVLAEPKVDFNHMLYDCATNGIVVIKQGLVLFAKPSRWDGRKAHFNYTGKNNCWFVLAAASELGMMEWMGEAPYQLEWVAFHRRGKLKAYTWKQLVHKVK